MPTVVTNDVLFHEPARRILQDVVTCIRHNVTIDDAGFRRERHADRYLKAAGRKWRGCSAAIPRRWRARVEIADRCRFSLDELAYQYPEERTMPGLTPQQALEKLTWEGAAERYPEGVPDKVVAILKHELRLIETLQYAPYFLTVNAIVRFARIEGHPVPGPRLGRQLAPSAMCSASPRSIPSATTCCSSASSPKSGASRPTSMSISSTSGARSSCSGCSRPTAATTPRCARPSSATGQRARCAMSARRSACPRT